MFVQQDTSRPNPCFFLHPHERMLRKAREQHCTTRLHRRSGIVSNQQQQSARINTTSPSSRLNKKIFLVCGLLVILAVFGVTYRSRFERLLPMMSNKTKKEDGSEMIRTSSSETNLPQDERLFTSLRIVSMNIAGCVPSAEAPPSWDKLQSSHAIRQELLKSDPDIIALQECPTGKGRSAAQWSESLLQGYKAMGSTPAHADNVVLLVRNTLASKATTISLQGLRLPCVMIQLEIGGNPNNNNNGSRHVIAIASCHLAPFAHGSYQRQNQIETILYKASPIPLIITGDTNMRETEDKIMENQFQLLDAWKLAGSNPTTQYSWDTIDHRNKRTNDNNNRNVNGPSSSPSSFNKYYGDSTRQYQARYDRMYIHKGLLVQQQQQQQSLVQVLSNVKVPDFQFIANEPLPGSTTHFLSDHFGLSVKIDLDWGTPA